MDITVLDEAAYQELVQGGEPIKRMPAGVKVWRLSDGRMVKLFRARGWFSRSRLRPASVRFAANATALRGLGFHTVTVAQLIFVPAMACHGVIYPALIGEPLEQALSSESEQELLEALALLMLELHNAGVLFRALHLGNLLLLRSGELALIDVEELTVSRRSLSAAARLRNFQHLLRRAEDRAVIGQHGFSQLATLYLQNQLLSARLRDRLDRQLVALEAAVHWPQPEFRD